MAIKIYVVICDRCDMEIDATKFTYYIHDKEDLCRKCHDETQGELLIRELERRGFEVNEQTKLNIRRIIEVPTYVKSLYY